MTHLHQSRSLDAAPQRRSGSVHLLIALGMSLIFLAAVLVLCAPRLLALPSETTISQRAQTATQTGATSLSTTYGEIVTVTLRFTITTGTSLTGPVEIGTRFTAPGSQLGLRFLGYQGPTGIGAEPPLIPTSFTSPTIGTTTYLTWTFDTITNTSGGSYVYELPYQVRFGWNGALDTQTNVAIPGTNTFIRWWPYTVNDRKTASNLTINRIIPNLSATYSTKTAGGAIQSGGTMVYTITLKNGNNTTGFSTAYELVITDSLDSHLAYVGAYPAPDSLTAVPGQNTVLTWTAANLAPNTTWVAFVTATLPATFTANAPYLNTVGPSYTTLPGIQPDEAALSAVIVRPISATVTASKRANPTANVRIGDAVGYTVLLTVPANAGMWSPIFTDTLPEGFRYRAGTFNLTGATLNSVVTATSGTKEQLIWRLADVQPNAGVQIIGVAYTADVSGRRTNGSAAYAPPTTAQVNADNAVQGTWRTDTAMPVSLGAALVGRTTIAQPLFPPANGLSKKIYSWPDGDDQEVGARLTYEILLTNTGTITAYEVVIDDLLPDGLIFQQTLTPVPVVSFLEEPVSGAAGTLRWVVQELPKTTLSLKFNVLVSDTARPGDTLSNTVSVIDYTSQPGEANPYDRHYNTIANALPAPSRVGFVLKGLNANKIDFPDPVLPNSTLTYTILYSNSSAISSATGAQLFDHYDPWLTFNGATVAASHDAVNRNLTWNVGTVPINSGNNTIVATFTVAADISRTVRMLTNTITSDWDSPAPAMTRLVTTTLVQPKPTVTLDDQGTVAQAGKLMTYTLIYTNAPAATGATTGTFTITLGYAEYVSYTAHTATPSPNPPGPWLIPGTAGSVFTDTLGPGVARTIRLRMMVDKPLPYTLEVFTSTATIDDQASDATDLESESTPVDIPIFTFYKVNMTPGNPPIGSGAPIGYQIFVTNTGPVTATNIIITDVWDDNTWNQIGGGNWTLQPNYGVYATIAALGPNKGVVLDPLNMNVAAALPVNAQLIHNIAKLTSAETTQQETSLDTPITGLYIQKSHDPDPVYPGEQLIYTIAYTTYKDGIVQPYISDTLPSQVTYIGCSGGESCDFNNGQVTWRWPLGLLDGDAGTVSVVVQAPAAEGITLTNMYASNGNNITYREGPPDQVYVGRPHMALTKLATTAVDPIAPGDQIVYTLNYTNSGSYKATGVQVFDQVPANTTYVRCEPAVSCSESNGIVTWDVGEVPAPGYGTLTLIVQVNPNAGTTTIVNNAYSLTADRGVANENTPPVLNVSVVQPALAVTKSASQSWIALGGTITYTVRYTNTGGGVFTSLRFTDTIDNRLNILAASAICSINAQVVICADANLAPTQSREFFIRAQSASLSNENIVTNMASYLASNQTETLPEATTPPVEVIATSTGAAANFSGIPTSGNIGLNVTFTNLSGGSGVTSCVWDFGDGQTSTAACQPGNTVNHTYSQPGAFTVKLTVTTANGSNMRTRANYITISGAATFGVQMASPQPVKSGRRATQVVYTLVITNTGTVPDSFALSLPPVGSYQWPTQLPAPASTGTLAAQGAATLQVTVSIPAVAPLVSGDVVTVTASSAGLSSVSHSIALQTSTLVYPAYLPIIRR
jgi:uncharacterized repeat protein (TIGR01451 family)/fimbrial isopeptide formation D2 family protein